MHLLIKTLANNNKKTCFIQKLKKTFLQLWIKRTDYASVIFDIFMQKVKLTATCKKFLQQLHLHNQNYVYHGIAETTPQFAYDVTSYCQLNLTVRGLAKNERFARFTFRRDMKPSANRSQLSLRRYWMSPRQLYQQWYTTQWSMQIKGDQTYRQQNAYNDCVEYFISCARLSSSIRYDQSASRWRWEEMGGTWLGHCRGTWKADRAQSQVRNNEALFFNLISFIRFLTDRLRFCTVDQVHPAIPPPRIFALRTNQQPSDLR